MFPPKIPYPLTLRAHNRSAAMACSSTSSLQLLSLTPKTLSLSSKSSPASCLSFLHSTSAIHFPKLLRSSSSTSFNHHRSFRRLVISSSDQEIYGDAEEEEEERPTSPDLKIFVGNLPFNVDSSALAGLFEQAGTVEMVEVYPIPFHFSFNYLPPLFFFFSFIYYYSISLSDFLYFY